MHERLRLCWLGRGTGPDEMTPGKGMGLPGYLFVHLFALVGHHAHLYI